MTNLNIKTKNVLLKPHITEKAALGADKSGVYVFRVASNATKKSISSSVRESYGVVPRKIRILAVTTKRVLVRGSAAPSGKKGVKGGGKKAYVYLKKGDKIEVM